jgi:multidrug efflux pump subunit AcrB
MPEEVAIDATAILEGEPAATPVITNDMAYTIRVCYPESSRSSLDAMSNTLLNSSSGHTATLGSLAPVSELPGQTEVRRENLQRDVTVTARLEGTDPGRAINAVPEDRFPDAPAISDSSEVQRHVRRAAEVIPRPDAGTGARGCAGVCDAPSSSSALWPRRFPSWPRRCFRLSGMFLALLITRTDFNIASLMGLIMAIGIAAKNDILLLDADEKLRRAGFSAETP